MLIPSCLQLLTRDNLTLTILHNLLRILYTHQTLVLDIILHHKSVSLIRLRLSLIVYFVSGCAFFFLFFLLCMFEDAFIYEFGLLFVVAEEGLGLGEAGSFRDVLLVGEGYGYFGLGVGHVF